MFHYQNSKLISPKKSEILKFDRLKEGSFPNSKFIYPRNYSRYHFSRVFYIKGDVSKVEIAFLSDNYLDIFLNGELISSKEKHFPLSDVTKYIKNGKNILHIRGYQTDTFDYFTSALTGGIKITYRNNKIRTIVTDKNFKLFLYNSYYENDEINEFATNTKGFKDSFTITDIHPIALKKSFYFIKAILIKKEIKKATFRCSCLGIYKPFVNNLEITKACFMPFNVSKQKEYQDFDITRFLKKGKNTISVILANGHYNSLYYGVLNVLVPKFIGEINIKYTDGTIEKIVTDKSWRTLPSPLMDNDIQFGERYDSNKEIESFSKLNLSCLKHCKEEICLIGFIKRNYPSVIKQKYYRLNISGYLKNNTPFYDVGELISGRVKVVFKNLKHNQKIRIRYLERIINNEGEQTIYGPVYYPNDAITVARGLYKNVDQYIAKGSTEETYEIDFAYTGFRYVYFENVDESQIKEVYAFKIYNNISFDGKFISSNTDLNNLFKAALRGWRNNIVNGPTDCPTREKNYWNGDIQIFSYSACFLSNCSSLLKQWTLNVIKMHDGPYGWEDELYELPYCLYKFYNDKDVLKKSFPSMLDLIRKREGLEKGILP